MSIPTQINSFFWKSKLSDERKQEIIDILGTLTPEQQEALEDWMDDCREEWQWDAREES